jgi:hypothetical protein
MKRKKMKIDSPLAGLTLMTMLTIIWTILAGINYNGSDYYISYAVFGFLVLYFIYSYYRLKKISKLIPREADEDTKKEKKYWIIFVLEGVFIFLVKNILDNINYSHLFLPIFALIVGLHFFPLAKVFERKFDYYIGAWTTIVAILGVIMTLENVFKQSIINGIVCTACSVSTSIYGLKMIREGNSIAAEK